MNKIITILLFIIGFGISEANSQCSDDMKTKCIPDINAYTTLKTYKISLNKRKNKRVPTPKARYSLMLSKGTRYRVSGCVDDKTAEKMIFSLFDNFGEISSSYNKERGKHYPAFEFICNKSGVYYLTFEFKKGVAGCGGASVSMRKN